MPTGFHAGGGSSSSDQVITADNPAASHSTIDTVYNDVTAPLSDVVADSDPPAAPVAAAAAASAARPHHAHGAPHREKAENSRLHGSRLAAHGSSKPRPWFGRAGDSNARRNWIIAGVASTILLASLGAAFVLTHSNKPALDYFEVYLTDVPGDFERVVLRLEGVYVGENLHPLLLEVTELDILAYQGAENSALIAYGEIPRGNHSQVTIVFASAAGLLDGQWVPIDVPQEALQITGGFATGETEASAVLFDLDMEQSLVLTDRGFSFQPHVESVYFHSYADGQAPGGAAGPHGPLSKGGFNDPPVKNPDQIRKNKDITPNPPGGRQTFPTGTNRNTYPGTSFTYPTHTDSISTRPIHTDTTTPHTDPVDPPTTPTTPTSSSNFALPTDFLSGSNASTQCGPENEGDPTCDGIDGIPMSAEGVHDYLVRLVPDDPTNPSSLFQAETGSVMSEEKIAVGVRLATWYGGTVNGYLQMSPTFIVSMTQDAARNLSTDRNVAYIERDQDVNMLSLPSARDATRWNALEGGALGDPILPSNLRYSGKGVGVAVVDTGVDATHPDLPFDVLGTRPATAVVYENFKVVSAGILRSPNSDTVLGSHGTQVAGVIVGQPSSTEPSQYGLAPGAKLYAWGVGEATTLIWIAQAYDDLIYMVEEQNLDPKIRVVSNSWSTGTTYDPNSQIIQQINRLLDNGIVMVFSAGNWGGNGAANQVSAQCQVPREGVICVGGFEDFDKGLRDQGSIYFASSRGSITDVRTWPDLVAPATRIQSTRSLLNAQSLGQAYGTMSGTSIAAPMVSAAVALMLEVNPGLTPAQVESILEQTAFEFADGGSYAVSGDPRYNGSHYAKGHGLLDVEAAVLRSAPNAINAGLPVGLYG